MAEKRRDITVEVCRFDLEDVLAGAMVGKVDEAIREKVQSLTKTDISMYKSLFCSVRINSYHHPYYDSEQDLIILGVREENDKEYKKRIAQEKRDATRKKKRAEAAAERSKEKKALMEDPEYQQFLKLSNKFKGKA